MFSDISSMFFNDPSEGTDIYGDIKNELTPYYNPYIQAGQQDMQTLRDQNNQMTNDPGSLYAQLGKGFQESPGYQYNVQQATQGANRAAAAGGQLGTPAEQLALSKQIGGMADQEYGNYMNQMMGLHQQGLQGMQNMTNMGYNASTGLGDSLANARMNQAGLQLAGKKSQNDSMSGLFSAAGMAYGGRK